MSEQERPDADGIRPLKAAVHRGRVYLDLESLTTGFRARADAIEAGGAPDVARLYRREADELDTAAIGWLSMDTPPTLPSPDALTVAASTLAVQSLAQQLRQEGEGRLAGYVVQDAGVTDRVGTIRVVTMDPPLQEAGESWLTIARREGRLP